MESMSLSQALSCRKCMRMYVVEACTVTVHVTYTDTLITHREVTTPPLSLLMPDHAHLIILFHCHAAELCQVAAMEEQ